MQWEDTPDAFEAQIVAPQCRAGTEAFRRWPYRLAEVKWRLLARVPFGRPEGRSRSNDPMARGKCRVVCKEKCTMFDRHTGDPSPERMDGRSADHSRRWGSWGLVSHGSMDHNCNNSAKRLGDDTVTLGWTTK